MRNCETCRCNKVCDHNNYGFENCGNYIPAVSIPSEFEGAALIINLGIGTEKLRSFGWKKEMCGALYGDYIHLREGHEAEDISKLIPLFAEAINETEKAVSAGEANEHFIQEIPDLKNSRRLPGHFVWVSDDEEAE